MGLRARWLPKEVIKFRGLSAYEERLNKWLVQRDWEFEGGKLTIENSGH